VVHRVNRSTSVLCVLRTMPFHEILPGSLNSSILCFFVDGC
jgi:hypothetical protein